MPDQPSRSLFERLRAASDEAAQRFNRDPLPVARLEDALASAMSGSKLLDNLAEAWRIAPDQAAEILKQQGLGSLIARAAASAASPTGDEIEAPPCLPRPVAPFAGGRIRLRTINPGLAQPQRAPAAVVRQVDAVLNGFLPGAGQDPLAVLYRDRPAEYCRHWLAGDGEKVRAYVHQHFGTKGPRYLVNSGIGANEQFNYFVSALANARPDRLLTWRLTNSPKELAALPADAAIENTLFMEFSRSGITEETVKLHELTPRSARRIVFANEGPLRQLAERDANLVLELPSEVSGRYGRNRTPILMAPMHVAGLDVAAYWSQIEAACDEWNLSDRQSLPVALARFLRIQQLRRSINHIYLGTNDSLLRCSADEWCQFWNEGVNREGNDITMSRYLGLPRDSHMNLEAILGTSERKLAVFLLNTAAQPSHPLLNPAADAIDPRHAKLTAGEVDLILAMANVQRCGEKMPVVLVAVAGVDLAVSAWLGQLWADVTLVYSRLVGVEPGSNPEVKRVRTRAAQWLAQPREARTLLD